MAIMREKVWKRISELKAERALVERLSFGALCALASLLCAPAQAAKVSTPFANTQTVQACFASNGNAANFTNCNTAGVETYGNVPVGGLSPSQWVYACSTGSGGSSCAAGTTKQVSALTASDFVATSSTNWVVGSDLLSYVNGATTGCCIASGTTTGAATSIWDGFTMDMAGTISPQIMVLWAVAYTFRVLMRMIEQSNED